MAKRERKNSNNYPTHSSHREIHSVLRTESGNIVVPIYDSKNDLVDHHLELDTSDIPEILYNEKGQRDVNSNTYKLILKKVVENLVISKKIDLKKERLYKYCIHCPNQKLLPIDNFTFNNSMRLNKVHNNRNSSSQSFCKSCKQNYVNSPSNKKRTSEQHAESSDISRVRKYFSYKDEKLNYDTIFDKFNYCCFNCLIPLNKNEKSNYQLDHTLPASLMYVMSTETATLLCYDCNQKKKDMWPSEFYNQDKIEQLSILTNLPREILLDNRHINPAFYKESHDDIINNIVEKSRREDKEEAIKQVYRGYLKISKKCSTVEEKERILSFLKKNKYTEKYFREV